MADVSKVFDRVHNIMTWSGALRLRLHGDVFARIRGGTVLRRC